MARIQILELPDEETPDGSMVTRFALILDQFDINELGPPFGIEQFADQCGARSILVSAHTIDIESPAVAQIGTVSVRVEPDVSGFEEAVREAVEKAERKAEAPTVRMPTVAQLEKAISYGLHFSQADEGTRNAARAIHDALAQQLTAEGATL